MIIIFILKFELIKILNCLLNKGLLLLNFLIHFVVDINFVNQFLIEFYHQSSILSRSLIEHSYTMQVNCFIKSYIFYLSLRLTD